MHATLLLADGREFSGEGFGATGISFGELVFNTAMTGYQEVLTDPSYCRQMVTMTAPEIGNYGCNASDDESAKVQIAGLIVRNLSPVASNFSAAETLDAYLKRHNTVAIQGLDTREITRSIRDDGHVMCALVHGNYNRADVLAQLAAQSSMSGTDLAREVSTETRYTWNEGSDGKTHVGSFKVVAVDFGIKRNILRLLVDAGCDLTVVPASTSADDIRSLAPQGLFLSNGPGDPAAVTYGVAMAKELMGQVPMFGICLGHQIMALAQGAESFKMKFGHRGANHPVRHESSGRIEITSQNHGFAVAKENLPGSLEVTHSHLNDGTISGLHYQGLNAFSVQYHPESAPGPHDSRYLFEQFIALMSES
jgi:carbamoyl-phosphate synthase small subunit